ncbi:uncharacterized protein GIQ15_00387 [Arthroderma uncinatum]|uniref:uncharacterized protein n=1 Tax=Arthroderma uncinatum TaxID=74035 RepID=UPI00144ACFFE|nr:uncharacterized protein GIQ15_00387 [Arthroderma uncinatum]KAF3490870.1 hypothetical protein GIQ15_00387 [Arthroderma uncinatum]
MDQENPFENKDVRDSLLQEGFSMDDYMALYNYVHDRENQATAASMHEGIMSDQEPAECMDGYQAQNPEAENQDRGEVKGDRMVTDNVSFDFGDLLNLEDAPAQMYDADLAPKHQHPHPHAHNNFQDTHTPSASEMIRSPIMPQGAIPAVNTPCPVATEGSEHAVMKHSPADYNANMGVDASPNQPFPPEFKDPRIRQTPPFQPHHSQLNANSEKTQVGQIHSIPPAISNYSGAQVPSTPASNLASTNMVDTTSVIVEEACAQEAQKKPGRKAGRAKGKSPTVEPKDERANLRDSDEPIVLQFSSSQEANDYRPDRKIMPVDPTVPCTVGQKKECVVQLIRAMKSVEHATDNWGMIKPFANRKFSDRKIEVCCWNILDCCVVRQAVGPFLTPEEESLKNKTKKNKQNFAERFADMINILRVRKTVCRHLLDPYYLLQFVDDPSSCLSRVDSNKTLNAKKKQAIDLGKKVMAKGTAGDDDVTAADEPAPQLASPFTTPKPETHTTCTSSRDPYMDRNIVSSIETPQGSQFPPNLPQANLQAAHMASLQPGSSRQQPILGPSMAYSSHPMNSFGTGPSIGYSQGHAYNSGRGAVGNMGYYNMGTTMNAPQVNISPTPRSPWNQMYSNAIPSAQYLMPPRTPNMPSLTSQFPTPPVSGRAASPTQAKPARKKSGKRSADGSDESESPKKKGRH